MTSDLGATQQGEIINLTLPLNRTPRSVLPLRVEIYRLIEPASAPLGMTEEVYSLRSSLIATLPVKDVPPGLSALTHRDSIDFQAAGGAPRYRYAVRVIQREEQVAAFSNYAMLTPELEIARPPGDLKATPGQTELEITWTAPAANISGKQPANVVGYNLYRRAAGVLARLNPKPLPETRYPDRAFQFETEYEYLVRALSLPAKSKNIAEALESNESATLKITPKDTFAPAAPAAITVASINGVVSLFWPANPETDVSGYYLYRAEAPDTPPAAWARLTPQPHKATSFRDDRVQAGKTYYYQLTAIDGAGNESPRSATIAETVNQ
ncbi:MAG: fibronectin type III domain-containing protein [Blastocatellia bacterium]